MLSKIYNLSFNSASFKTPWEVIQANNKFINLMTWIRILKATHILGTVDVQMANKT